jgi:hypothetical protein
MPVKCLGFPVEGRESGGQVYGLEGQHCGLPHNPISGVFRRPPRRRRIVHRPNLSRRATPEVATGHRARRHGGKLRLPNGIPRLPAQLAPPARTLARTASRSTSRARNPRSSWRLPFGLLAPPLAETIRSVLVSPPHGGSASGRPRSHPSCSIDTAAIWKAALRVTGPGSCSCGANMSHPIQPAGSSGSDW